MDTRTWNHITALEARGHWGIKRGLENPRLLQHALGDPGTGFPVVLIAGTNGKGSTGAFMAHALREAGLVVGWTTSPHLLHPRERIWVDGAPLSEGALDLLLGEAFEAETRAGIQATYFELMITAALLAFRMHEVDIALVEVGMGGRWDATNTLDPVLTVLTNVGLDHVQYLGDTREAIGREKLCTARQGRPLVLGPGLAPAWTQPLLETHPELLPVEKPTGEPATFGVGRLEGHPLGLAGAHQADNAATALTALRRLRQDGFPVPEEAIWTGFARAQWPGRLWKVPGLQEVWMDGAHNPDGAAALAAHLRNTHTRPHLLFGAMGDKDLASVAQILRGTDPASVTLVRGENERYATAEALQQAWGHPFEVLDIPQACAHLQSARPGPRLVTGSLFLIGDLLRALDIQPWGR